MYVYDYEHDYVGVSCYPRQGDTRGSRQGNGTRSAR